MADHARPMIKTNNVKYKTFLNDKSLQKFTKLMTRWQQKLELKQYEDEPEESVNFTRKNRKTKDKRLELEYILRKGHIIPGLSNKFDQNDLQEAAWYAF